jgi:hypothetical protein
MKWSWTVNEGGVLSATTLCTGWVMTGSSRCDDNGWQVGWPYWSRRSHVLQQDLVLIGVDNPRNELGCACCLGAVHAAVADQHHDVARDAAHGQWTGNAPKVCDTVSHTVVASFLAAVHRQARTTALVQTQTIGSSRERAVIERRGMRSRVALTSVQTG